MAYPGGKGAVYHKIINVIPPHDVYIEPFLGSGAVMRLKRPAKLNIGLDLAASAVQAMRSYASKWERAPAESSFTASGSAHAGLNGGARAAGSLKVPRAGEASGGIATSSDPHRRRARVASLGGPGGPGDASSRWEFRLGDGIEFLRTYPYTGGELIYCDPPYLHSTRDFECLDSYGAHEMNDVDHRRLLSVLRSLRRRCMILISGYQSKMYETALEGWNHITFTAWTRHNNPREEWLWFNFPRSIRLHDYRYLGEDFRERELLKKMQKRWKAKFEKLPELNKQALLSAIAGIV